MDVHKPHPFHNWREFLKEYGIIVLGVLTALFFEQAVQSVEWRHKVDAAIEDMDQEMSNGNGPQAYVRLALHRCLSQRLQALRNAINGGDRNSVRRGIDEIALPLRNYNSHAREAANSADIESRIPPDRMYEYRIIYALIPELDDVHRKELGDLAQLRSLPATGGPLDQDEKRAGLEAVENLMLDNDRMKRASAFTLRHMRDLGIGVNHQQLEHNLDDVPTFRSCLTRDVTPMIDLSPPTSGIEFR